MKKSEMVNEIAKVIAGFKGSTEPTRNDMYVASSILLKVESLGMEPRAYFKDLNLVNTNPGEKFALRNEWEPEND